MKVVFTVQVRNPQWFWSDEQMKEAGEYREVWEMINKKKVDEHNPMWQYEIPFEVKDISVNRNTEYEIKFVSAKDKEDIIPYILNDVTVVKFIGDKQTLDAVISNSLIHQYFGAQQSGYKHYMYVYLSENAAYYHPLENLYWISEDAKSELENYLGVDFI